MRPWNEPSARYQTGTDSRVQHDLLTEHGESLGQWSAVSPGEAPTGCFRLNQHYWIWQAGVGGIEFSPDVAAFTAFPDPGADPSWFQLLLTRRWIPAAYPFWSRQVLHASAVADRVGSRAVAFTGESGAGKSTLAYGLSRRDGWRHLSDDTLAFSCDAGRVRLHPLRHEVRLRPETSAHFGWDDSLADLAEWPAVDPNLAVIYCLAEGDARSGSAIISPVCAGAAYTTLLGQAHAATLAVPHYNRLLMADYLTLASAVPVFRITYRRSFEIVEQLFDEIEEHLSTLTAA